MTKAILLQCPKKFYEVLPIFYKEAKKYGIFDKFYIITDYADAQKDFGDDCHVVVAKDKQFSSNISYLLKYVTEDVVFLCCEDHIMTGNNTKERFDEIFQYVVDNKDVGFLRLTCQEKADIIDHDDQVVKFKKSYKYYISLQPAIWRKKYLENVIKEGEDAWKFETEGSKRARKFKGMSSYMVKERVFCNTNFFKSGEYYRNKYIDYCLKNDLPFDKNRKVAIKNKVMTLNEYLETKK